MRMRQWVLGLAGGFLAVTLAGGLAAGQEKKDERQSDRKSEQGDRKSDQADRKEAKLNADSGEVKSIKDGKITVTTRGGQERTFEVKDSAGVTLNGQKAQ